MATTQHVRARILACFLVLLTSLTVLSTPPPALADSADNLILDPGIEDTSCGGLPCHWTMSAPGAMIYRTPVFFHSGASSLAVAMYGSAETFYVDYDGCIPVEAGREYTFKTMGRRTAGYDNSAAHLVVNMYGDDSCAGGPLGTTQSTPTTLDTNWQQLGTSWTVPSGVVALRIALVVTQTAFSVNMFFDDFELYATAPATITPVLTPATPNGSNGWYRSPVIVSWTIDDSNSPATAQSADCAGQMISSTGPSGQTLTCRVTNAGGAIGEASVTVYVDTTPPTLVVGALVVDATTKNGATASVTPQATDATSGVASVVCSLTAGGAVTAATVFPIGSTDITCIATDLAGNSTTASGTVSVRGAAEQLDRVQDAVNALPSTRFVKAYLLRMIHLAQETMPSPTACAALRNAIFLSTWQGGANSTMTADLTRITHVLDCGAAKVIRGRR